MSTRVLLMCLAAGGMLAACGGSDVAQTSNAGQGQLLANGEACNPAWIQSKQYSTGAKISYKGYNYTAAHATNWDDPAQNHTQADGDPWIQGFTCSGTATTTTSKATTTTTKAGTTTTKASTTSTAATTTTTKSTTTTTGSGSYTAAAVLNGVNRNMITANQVNTSSHIDTMTRAAKNVYQVAPGVFAYAGGMAVDTDGSDPDPDPDHQGQTTWQDDAGKSLGAHHVPFYVLGDYCYDKKSPCPHFYYGEHNIKGLQFALIFYNGKVIGAVFGDTQGDSVTPTSDNDSRELGEASVESAALLGIPSSGTTGGVDSGVTVVIFSGSQWVVKGTNATLKDNAQAMVQKALNTLGASMGL